MNLRGISNIELRDRLARLVRTERKITHLILDHIIEFESRKLYADYGYPSMFEYLTRSLGYSEISAYRRLQSARAMKGVPDVSQKIELGSLNLSQLTEVQKHIRCNKNNGASTTIEKKQALFVKLENKTIFQTKTILAQEFNLPIQSPTRLTPQKDESVRVELTFTMEQFAEIRKAKDLLSHICPDGELNEIIGILAQKFNQTRTCKNESKKFKDVKINSNENYQNLETASELLTQRFAAKKLKQRKYITKPVKNYLAEKAKHACEFVSLEGHRCSSTYQLQIDHKIPVAKGGRHDSENLRLLCRTHNNLMARRWGLTI